MKHALRLTAATLKENWPFSLRRATLTDLNAAMGRRGYARLTADDARALGLAVRVRLSKTGKPRNIVVGLTPEDVDRYWAFADEGAAR